MNPLLQTLNMDIATRASTFTRAQQKIILSFNFLKTKFTGYSLSCLIFLLVFVLMYTSITYSGFILRYSRDDLSPKTNLTYKILYSPQFHNLPRIYYYQFILLNLNPKGLPSTSINFLTTKYVLYLG